MKKINWNEFKSNGYFVLTDALDSAWIDLLSVAVNDSFEEHKKYQEKNNSDIKTDGVALHALMSSPLYLKLLEYLISVGLIEELEVNFFKSKCILNSLSALNNLPNKPNFSAVVHRDLRFYSGTFPTMLNCLIMVDDFTKENGGTFLLPKSHLYERKPTDAEFFSNCIQIVGKSGSILIFDSNVWHASAPNKTNSFRRAIPITLSRSFMKQLLDYPRAIGYKKMNLFSEKLQQLLGYHSRVPASLDEWYQPETTRLYKKNQD